MLQTRFSESLHKYAAKIWCILKCPFQEGLPLFCVLLILNAVQLHVDFITIHQFGIGTILGSFAWAYTLTLPFGLSKAKWWRRSISAILIFLCSVSALTLLILGRVFQEQFIIQHLHILLATNFGEATEFTSTYFSANIAVPIALIILSAIFTYIIAQRVNKLRCAHSHIGRLITALFSMGGGISILITSQFSLWTTTGIGRIVDSIIEQSKCRAYDLKKTQREFSVEEASGFHVPTIILIMGESFDKDHSNLYGYYKLTNPSLTALYKSNQLIVFNNINSSAPNTAICFQLMFTLSDSLSDIEFYYKPTLPTSLRKAGYYTNWISNQNPNYVYSNILPQLAYLCNECHFCNNDIMGEESRDDKAVLPYFASALQETKKHKRNFIFLQLYGSHVQYHDRFPKEYARFKASDYIDRPQHQRQTLADYDNSILYNDHIVDSLIRATDGIDAIVIYTSDHGQDIYYTRPDIAAHGRIGEKRSFEAGCHVPFMVHYTPQFRKNHPHIVAKIDSHKDDYFETKYLMNTILELAGYKIKGHDTFAKSLFKGRLTGNGQKQIIEN